MEQLAQKEAITTSKKKSLGKSFGNFVGKKLGKYALSEYCKALGLKKTPKYEMQLDEIIEGIEELKEMVGNVLTELTYIEQFQEKIYSQMEADKYYSSLTFINNIKLLEDTNWTQFVNAIGNNKTLEDLANDEDSLEKLAPLLTNDYLNKLTNESNILTGISPAAGTPFEDLLRSKKNYTNSLIPVQGKKGNDLVQLLDEANETLLNLYYESLNAVQCIYIIQKTALYLKYHSNNKDLQNITLAEKNIKNDQDFETNDEHLFDDYSIKFNKLDSLVVASVVSDTFKDDFKVTQRAIEYTGVPKGDWVNDCVLFAWCGVAEEKDAYVGLYNGITLKAKSIYNNTNNESTLNLNDANNPATDKPVLTHTKEPYLECEFLKQNTMSYSEKSSNDIGGYCDSYSGNQMTSIDVDKGIIIYGDQDVIKENYSLLAPNKHQTSINQFIQVNFSTKERALFQFTRGASKLINIQMGKGGDYKWTYSDNKGKTSGIASFGGWKGGGYSEITLTSKSKEESVIIKVDGEKHKSGKNYNKPSLSLTKK